MESILTQTPLTPQERDALSQEVLFAPVAVKVLKSAISDRVLFEHQTAQLLRQECVELAKCHGVAVADDLTPVTNPVPNPEGIVKAYCDGLTYDYQRIDARAWFSRDIQFQAYTKRAATQPLLSYDRVTALFRQLNALCQAMEIQNARIQKGQDGEDLVNAHLALFEGKYPVRSNVLLRSRTDSVAQSSEIDCCVITPKGVFVCEVKNIGNAGTTIHVARDGRWEIVHNASGNTEVKTPSPTEQNALHCLEMERLLQMHGMGHVSVIPVVIIANSDTAIANDSMNYVVRPGELYNLLRCDPTPVCLDEAVMERVAGLLDQEQVSERKFHVDTISGFADDIKAQLTLALDAYEKEAKWGQECLAYFHSRARKGIAKDLAKQERDRKATGWPFTGFIPVVILCVVDFFGMAWLSSQYSGTSDFFSLWWLFSSYALINWNLLCMIVVKLTDKPSRRYIPGLLIGFAASAPLALVFVGMERMISENIGSILLFLLVEAVIGIILVKHKD